MNLKHYEIIQNPGEAWYGYRQLGCPLAVREALKRESQIAESKGCISERELEVDLFLSILTDIKRPHINLIEAGAGWGEWCMALAGVIEKKIIPVSAKSYFAIGVEGDYDFYQHMARNFRFNHISAIAKHGAVSNELGFCRFNTGFISRHHCGGNLGFGVFKGSPLAGWLLGVANIFTGKSIRVPLYTIDFLMQKYSLGLLDILHVDVQGSELEVLRGATYNLRYSLINYILIGTHAPNLHSKVEDTLVGNYDIIAEAVPGKKNTVAGLPPVWIEKGQDGLILFKRKGCD